MHIPPGEHQAYDFAGALSRGFAANHVQPGNPRVHLQ